MPRFIGAAGDETEDTPGGGETSLFRRLPPLIAQLVLFPGNITNVTFACLGDFALAALGQPSWICRAAFLIVYCSLGLASKIHRTRATMRHLRSLPLDPP